MRTAVPALGCLVLGLPYAASADDACERLKSLALPDTTIASAEAEDFDGYLVGAPGTDIPNTFIEALYIRRLLGTLPAAEQLGPGELRLVSDAARERCDLLDGVEDGVLDDPRRCDLDVGTLVCSDETSADCLTPAQADVIEKIHAGLTDPANGELLTPGQRATMGAEDYTLGLLPAPIHSDAAPGART